VNANARRFEFRVQPREIRTKQQFTPPRPDFALADCGCHALDGFAYPQFPQYFYSVGPKSDSCPNLAKLRCPFVYGNIPTRLFQRYRCGQSANTGSNNHRPRHNYSPSFKLQPQCFAAATLSLAEYGLKPQELQIPNKSPAIRCEYSFVQASPALKRNT
jgi:hypothetical protein